MRIWDVDTEQLCDQHLLGEHRELHAVWSILTEHKKGYARHPETLRWRGRLAALYARHEQQVAEMTRRGFQHRSPLDARQAVGAKRQTKLVDTIESQRARLRGKDCGCSRRVGAVSRDAR